MWINWSENPLNADLLTYQYLIKSNTIPVKVPVHLANGDIKMETRYKSPDSDKASRIAALKERYKKLQEKQKAAETDAASQAKDDKKEAIINRLVDGPPSKNKPPTPSNPNPRFSPTEQMLQTARKTEQIEAYKRADDDAKAKKKARIQEILEGKVPESQSSSDNSTKESISYSAPENPINFRSKAVIYNTLGWDVDKSPDSPQVVIQHKQGITKRNMMTTSNLVSAEDAKKLPFSSWTSKLTGKERQRCEKFFNKECKVVNLLLGGVGQPRVTTPVKQTAINYLGEVVKDVDSAIDKFELPHAISVRTSIFVPRSSTLKELFPEGTMVNPGYTVTSCIEDSSQPVTASTPDGEELNNRTHKCLNIKITVPAGKGVGAFFGPLREGTDSQQFILPRGTQLHLDVTPGLKTLRQYADVVNLRATVTGRSVENIEDVKQRLSNAQK